MSNGLPVNLAPLLPHVPAWLMVLFRLTGIFFFAPVLGSRTIPAKIKIFLAVGLSFCIYPILLEPGSPSAHLVVPVVVSGLKLWSLVSTVGVELLIGIVIGYGASLPLIGMQIGGRIIDQQMGLGLAGVLNPQFNEQTGVVSEFFFILALTIFIILGGHRVMLAVLVGSFSKIPLGGLAADSHLLDLVIGLMGTVFDLAMRVSGPLLCLIFLQTVAMGFIARTVPQMNILSIGFSLRILAGMVLLIGTFNIASGVYVESVEVTLESIRMFFNLN